MREGGDKNLICYKDVSGCCWRTDSEKFGGKGMIVKVERPGKELSKSHHRGTNVLTSNMKASIYRELVKYQT